MANPEHLDILRQGVVTWNQWIKQRQDSFSDTSDFGFSAADLGGAYLGGENLIGVNFKAVNLRHANLSDANLRSADLSEIDLYSANLTSADLSNANLSRATLLEAILSGANLSGANLSGANLNFTDLSHAKLKEANLSKANINGTIFAQMELHTTKGLLEIQHDGPSIVQLHTVKLPPDGSALHFLRGAGVPDEWIDFWYTTTMHPIQYHSLFISYSSKDEVLARRLHADLQNHGVRCWFAPEDMKIGDKIRVRIDEAIHLQDKLLLILSEHALASTWVEDEVEVAMEKEQRQQREVLFPVRLDESIMQTNAAWAAKLRRTRHIGDFTNWTDPRTYQQTFERLLRDLKTESILERETDGKPEIP